MHLRTSLRRSLALIILSLFAANAAFAQIAVVVGETPEGRTVRHGLGETVVPANPQRIVSLHNIFSEALVAFGHPPVGATVRPTGLPDQLADGLADVVTIGESGSPDFEAILALEPDLILGQADVHGEFYDLLKAIAPTVLLDEPEAEWREWFSALGAALGMQVEADAAVAAYDSEAERVKARLAAELPGETVLVLRVREKDIRVYGGSRRSGPVLYTDLGLTPHPLVPLDKEHETISNEIIPELTADHIFLMVEDEARQAGLEATALWQGLPAVQAGHVYRVNMEPWNRSTGPISFGAIVSDVEQLLLGGALR